MKFNLSNCMKNSCLLHGVPCIEFAVGSELKNKIGSEEPIAIDSEMDIQLISAKYFFQMARKKGYKGYLWIPRFSTSDCKYCETSSSTKKKWCVSTTSRVVPDDFNKFMKGKPSYTCRKLMKKILKEYHSEIDKFLKQNADILLDHRDKNYVIELLESKQALFVQNYKPLLEQETDTMKKYIDKHLGKNFIRSSLSAAAVPVLLVRKPEGELKFYVDYRAFNAITVKKQIFNTTDK